MSQRESGYERKERDLYETPAWVTQCLRPHIWPIENVWEPAAGNGSIANVLEQWGVQNILSTDLAMGWDFLEMGSTTPDVIITNPPYTLAQEFIEQSLELTRARNGRVAMLLRVDFDSAVTRRHLFKNHPAWCKKVVLLKRIVWIETDDKDPHPSSNHAWFIWDWKNLGRPATLAYGP